MLVTKVKIFWRVAWLTGTGEGILNGYDKKEKHLPFSRSNLLTAARRLTLVQDKVNESRLLCAIHSKIGRKAHIMIYVKATEELDRRLQKELKELHERAKERGNEAPVLKDKC